MCKDARARRIVVYADISIVECISKASSCLSSAKNVSLVIGYWQSNSIEI